MPTDDKTYDMPTILKLYSDANSENFLTHAGFLSDTKAEEFVMLWQAAGHSVAWVKCGYVE